VYAINSKIFYFWGIILDLDKYTLPGQIFFGRWGGVGERSSYIRVIYIWVNMVIAGIGTTWTQCTCIFEKSN